MGRAAATLPAALVSDSPMFVPRALPPLWRVKGLRRLPADLCAIRAAPPQPFKLRRSPNSSQSVAAIFSLKAFVCESTDHGLVQLSVCLARGLVGQPERCQTPSLLLLLRHEAQSLHCGTSHGKMAQQSDAKLKR